MVFTRGLEDEQKIQAEETDKRAQETEGAGMWDLIARSKLTRLEQIRHNIKDHKVLVKYWEKLETEETILTAKRGNQDGRRKED